MPFQHFRDRDHTGTQDDTTVVLGSAIGPYPAGTTVAAVLADLNSRINVSTSTDTVVGSFTANAFVGPVFRANAVLFKAQAGSFTADAILGRGGSFTANAISRVARSGSFTANAALV